MRFFIFPFCTKMCFHQLVDVDTTTITSIQNEWIDFLFFSWAYIWSIHFVRFVLALGRNWKRIEWTGIDWHIWNAFRIFAFLFSCHSIFIYSFFFAHFLLTSSSFNMFALVSFPPSTKFYVSHVPLLVVPVIICWFDFRRPPLSNPSLSITKRSFSLHRHPHLFFLAAHIRCLLYLLSTDQVNRSNQFKFCTQQHNKERFNNENGRCACRCVWKMANFLPSFSSLFLCRVPSTRFEIRDRFQRTERTKNARISHNLMFILMTPFMFRRSSSTILARLHAYQKA